RPAGIVPPSDGVDVTGARRVVDEALAAAPDQWLEPAAVRDLLLAYGVPVVEERLAVSVEAAGDAPRELGFPGLLKSAVAGSHKGDGGGVARGLGDERALVAAAERIGPPLVVQTHVTCRTELLAGVVQDPLFGPLVAFGPGGVAAELIGGAQF